MTAPGAPFIYSLLSTFCLCGLGRASARSSPSERAGAAFYGHVIGAVGIHIAAVDGKQLTVGRPAHATKALVQDDLDVVAIGIHERGVTVVRHGDMLAIGRPRRVASPHQDLRPVELLLERRARRGHWVGEVENEDSQRSRICAAR